MRWVGRDLDDGAVRHRFIGALRNSRLQSFHTPYWKCDFIDWLVFEATVCVVNLEVKSIDRDNVVLTADASGVQTEGICLVAEFTVPTRLFTRKQLSEMVHDFEYDACRTVGKGYSFAPLSEEYITDLEWSYDGTYDERDLTYNGDSYE